MNLDALYSELTLKTKAKLVLLVLDGLGDMATKEQNYLTPLEAASTPNLDALAKDSAQGRMIPVAPGITPGSGPGHSDCSATTRWNFKSAAASSKRSAWAWN